jgi:hypothetical protein
MKPYKDEHRVPKVGLFILVVVTVVGGIVLGILATYLPDAILFKMVLLFGGGVLSGLVTKLGIRLGKIRAPLVGLFFGLITAIIMYGSYWLSETRLGNDVLSGSIWLYWFFELLIILIISGLIGRRAAQDHFCTTCNRWFKTREKIGGIPKRGTEQLVESFRAGNYEEVSQLVHYPGHKDIDLFIQACNCKNGNKMVSAQSKKFTLRKWLSNYPVFCGLVPNSSLDKKIPKAACDLHKPPKSWKPFECHNKIIPRKSKLTI